MGEDGNPKRKVGIGLDVSDQKWSQKNNNKKKKKMKKKKNTDSTVRNEKGE